MKDKKETKKTYNQLARFYHEKRMKGNNFNELLEQPISFNLLGNIKNKKVLDAGCGSGIYSKLLYKKGAKVSGLEISEKMLNIAREYCKNCDIDFKHGSIDKMPYKDRTFDIVLCSLAIHYLKKPEKAFEEFNRVLKKNGILIFSTNHPVMTANTGVRKEGKERVFLIKDYFQNKKFYWNIHGSKVKIPSYPISFEKIFDMLYKNNFITEKVKEPFLKKKQKIPEYLKKLIGFPTFIVIKARKLKNDNKE